MLDDDFFHRLQKFMMDHPGSVTSYVRTEARNKRIGGAPQSAHLLKYGNAIDLVYDTLEELYDAAANAHEYGFTGIELDLTNHHLHLDTKPRLWRVVRQKNKKGKKYDTPLEEWKVLNYPTLRSKPNKS